MHGGRGITGGVDVDLRTTSAVRPRTKGCTPYDTSSFFKRVLYSRYLRYGNTVPERDAVRSATFMDATSNAH
jgi:hypothetical protein